MPKILYIYIYNLMQVKNCAIQAQSTSFLSGVFLCKMPLTNTLAFIPYLCISFNLTSFNVGLLETE